jgi:hypothetical protein
MNQAPQTDPRHVKRLAQSNREASSWKAANEWFGETYYKPLLAFVRAKLAAKCVPQALQQNADDYLNDFIVQEWENFRVCGGWEPSKGRFHRYLRTAVSNLVARRLSQDSQPGTPEEYEPYRTALEDHVREQILRPLVERHPDWQEIAPARLLVVEDWVREFLEHHASRHPHPSRPRQKSPATDGANPAGELPEQQSPYAAILEGLKDECWRYVRDEGRRRRKRRGTKDLSDRADGWQPVARKLSPSRAFARTWAIDPRWPLGGQPAPTRREKSGGICTSSL